MPTELSPDRVRAQRRVASHYSPEALKHELEFAERCASDNPILVSWLTVLRVEYAGRADGTNEECGSCGAMIGPCTNFPWHYEAEDCRAAREPVETGEWSRELPRSLAQAIRDRSKP